MREQINKLVNQSQVWYIVSIMARLKDRQRHIPGGYRMRIPALKYQSSSNLSFDSLVREVQRVILANLRVAREHGLPTEIHKIEEWVDRDNADLCERNGWTTYYMTDGGAPPKWIAPTLLRRLGVERVAAGAKSLLSWLGEGAQPVPPQLAEKRSNICSQCEFNRAANLGDIFVRTASEMIRRQVEFARECGLKTLNDDRLGICSVCTCPLKLMVHVGLEHKLKSLDEETFSKLPGHCWVKRENNEHALVGTLAAPPPEHGDSLQPQTLAKNRPPENDSRLPKLKK
jgi:hypothetical protein